jgi:hypothetical protein
MPVSLHSELQKLAGPNPAAYMSRRFVNYLVFDRFLKELDRFVNVEFILGDQMLLACKVTKTDFSTPPGASAEFVSDQINPGNDAVLLELRSDLTVEVQLYVKGKPAAMISTVKVEIKDISVSGSYQNNSLTFQSVDFKPIITPPVRDNDADQNMQDAKIDPLEATRFEGLIAYGAVPQVIRQSIGQPRTFNLVELYPAFDFGKSAKLFPVDGGESLAIVPTDFSINKDAICECKPGVPLDMKPSQSTIVVPANPQNGPLAGQITLGGPIPQNIDPMKDLGKRYAERYGLAGVYMPESTYEGLTVRVMPAVEVEAEDNGFIGFTARATVGFSKAAVSLDAARGGIILDFDLDISGHATCTLDMLCFRLPIGYAIFQPAPGSQAHLTMGFYPAVNTDGTVQLKAILQKADMGSFTAVVAGVGAALEVIGVTAWLGFLIDTVLSLLISIKLPSALKDAIEKYLGNGEWVLLNFGDLIHQLEPTKAYPFETDFDVDTKSILASVDFRG